MNPKPLKWLLLKGLLLLVVGLLLWILVQPSYSKLLVSVSQRVLSGIEKGERTSVRLQENSIVYVPLGLATKDQKPIPAGRREVRDLHYNSVIFFALILFTPGLGLGKRVGALLAGLVLLFLTQVATVLVQIKFFYAVQLGEYSRLHYGPWAQNTYAFLKQFFELIGRFAFPFAIWMLFTYRETIGYLTGTPAEKTPRKKKKK